MGYKYAQKSITWQINCMLKQTVSMRGGIRVRSSLPSTTHAVLLIKTVYSPHCSQNSTRIKRLLLACLRHSVRDVDVRNVLAVSYSPSI